VDPPPAWTKLRMMSCGIGGACGAAQTCENRSATRRRSATESTAPTAARARAAALAASCSASYCVIPPSIRLLLTPGAGQHDRHAPGRCVLVELLQQAAIVRRLFPDNT